MREAGDAVTPVGSPVMLRLTGELNTPTALAVMFTCCAAPPMGKLMLAGFNDRLKSGGGV